MFRVSDFITHETRTIFNCPTCTAEMPEPKGNCKEVLCPQCGQKMIGSPGGRLEIDWKTTLLASDHVTPSGLFACPICGAGQTEKSHGKRDSCLCCGQGMVRYGNGLFLIGKRKHFWTMPERKCVDSETVVFGRYSVELSFWVDEWHALVMGPTSQMNDSIVEHVLLSDKDRVKVSRLALTWLYENVG